MRIPGVLPEHILKRMPASERARLGKAGLLAGECREIAIAKNEKQLQEQIEGMLRREGIWPIRQRMDRKSNVAVGTPDILFVVENVPMAWEVKMLGRNPTAEQVEAMRQMTSNGWRCSVVRSYDEARALLLAVAGNSQS